MEFVAVGNRKKPTSGTIAAKGAPTMRIQHKHGQTTDLWEEIQEVYSRPTEATRRLLEFRDFEGKEEKGVDRGLPRWKSTNVPPGTIHSLPGAVVVACVWAPEERIWALEVFIVGEGIHFIVDDPVRLLAQPNLANIIAAELGMKTHGH